MAAVKSFDDPMDLGPFLQNYVMKNPFSESSLLAASSVQLPPSTSSSSGSIATKSAPCVAVTSTDDVPSQCGDGFDNRQPPRTVAELLLSNGKTLKADAAAETRKSKRKRLLADASFNGFSTALRSIRPRNENNGGVVTLSRRKNSSAAKVETNDGAHHQTLQSSASDLHRQTKRSIVMLSNHDEMMDKYGNNSTNADRLQIESWMRDNYRYLHGNRRLFVSTQHLLLRSQQFFPSVTGKLIDEIVLCLYPKCEKMPKRHGSVYVGLVARPEPDILDNPVFMTALESVISGVLPVRCAAEKFGIRETSLVAAVMWTSIEPQSSGDGDSESSAFDRILQAELDRVSHLSDAGAARSVKRRVKRSAPPSRDCSIVNISESETTNHRRFKSVKEDNFDFELMMLQDAGSTSSLGDSASQERTPSRQSTLCLTFGVGDQLASSPPLHSCFEPLEIKSEPIDDEGSTLEVPITDDEEVEGVRYDDNLSSCETSRSPNNLDVLYEEADKPRDLSCLSSRGVCDTAVVASNSPTFSEDASRLRTQLAAAHETNLALKEELTTRNFQLARLADDFFRLQEQFKKLAGQFHRALADVRPRADAEDHLGNGSR